MYEGYYDKDGVTPHGKGKLIVEGVSIYEGMFEHGVKEGEGTETLNSGIKYLGYWHNDNKHGEGKQINPDGTENKIIWNNGIKVSEEAVNK
jgi:hypothetical protein